MKGEDQIGILEKVTYFAAKGEDLIGACFAFCYFFCGEQREVFCAVISMTRLALRRVLGARP